jgi:hypothetical protein
MTAFASRVRCLLFLPLLAFAVGGVQAASAQSGSISVRVTLQGEPTAAARTWRFEVVNASGAVVETLVTSTSGDQPGATATTAALPRGIYSVRPALSNDASGSCSTGSLYEVSPASPAATIEVRDTPSTVSFTIRACGVIGETATLPAPGVVDTVRGDRSAGPSAPLPPATGDSEGTHATGGNHLEFFALLGISLGALSGASATFAASHQHRRR